MTDLTVLQTSIPQIEENIGYVFSNKILLLEAFTHRSILNELIQNNNPHFNNERLEFLGDAVINLYVTSELYIKYPEWNEGLLSQAKALLVSEESFHKIVNQLEIYTHLIMGKGEMIQKSYLLPSIQANLFEAIIGAIFIDGGMASATKTLKRLLRDDFFAIQLLKEELNPKSQLQEMLAQAGCSLPEYRLLQEKGPQHEKKFLFSVIVQGLNLGTGWGESKKEAQKQAAKEAIEYIKAHGLPHFSTSETCSSY
ncbi:MAG: ribonuclease III [Chlamydia sp.]